MKKSCVCFHRFLWKLRQNVYSTSQLPKTAVTKNNIILRTGKGKFRLGTWVLCVSPKRSADLRSYQEGPLFLHGAHPRFLCTYSFRVCFFQFPCLSCSQDSCLSVVSEAACSQAGKCNCLKRGLMCWFHPILTVALGNFTHLWVSGVYGKALNTVLGIGQALHKC